MGFSVLFQNLLRPSRPALSTNQISWKIRCWLEEGGKRYLNEVSRHQSCTERTRITEKYFYKPFFPSGAIFKEWLNLIVLRSIPVAIPRWSHAAETPVEGAVSVNAQVRRDTTLQGLKWYVFENVGFLKHNLYFNRMCWCSTEKMIK